MTHDTPDDPYYHNDCLDWTKHDYTWCAKHKFDNLPSGIDGSREWEFCYLFRGDELDDSSKRDFFTFDGGKRAISRMRDEISPKEEVEGKCKKLCRDEYAMEMFVSKYGGWFSRMDGFHVSFFFFSSFSFFSLPINLSIPTYFIHSDKYLRRLTPFAFLQHFDDICTKHMDCKNGPQPPKDENPSETRAEAYVAAH